ncbi:MAG TPA: hypothetical protein VHI50_06730 [Micromonosporaceae bacterium]|jgi:hypothetical protein|nr:hypothetical protein [Micromonosporaceae bacterium]
MTRTRLVRTSVARRTASVAAALALGLAALAGCSSEGVETDCSLNACTLTFDRGVDASASVLGVEAKLIDADDEKVTLEVAGERVTANVGQAATDVGGVQVSVERVTEDQVVAKIAR